MPKVEKTIPCRSLGSWAALAALAILLRHSGYRRTPLLRAGKRSASASRPCRRPVDVYPRREGIRRSARRQRDLFMAKVCARPKSDSGKWTSGAISVPEGFRRFSASPQSGLLLLRAWAGRRSPDGMGDSAQDAKTILQAYATGSTAYLARQQGPSLSLESGVSNSSPKYFPRALDARQPLTWAKARSWDLRGM